MAGTTVVTTHRAGPTRQSVRRREILLAYLFILPALLATAIFGLYPVLSGFLISLQGGVVIPEGFAGLHNYFEVLSSLAYLLVIAIAIALVVLASRIFQASYRAMQGRFFLYLVPGAFAAAATVFFLFNLFTDAHEVDWLPEILAVIALVLYVALVLRQPAGTNATFLDIVRSWGAMLLTLSATLLLLFDLSELDDVVSPALAALGQATNSPIIPLATQYMALAGVLAAAIAVIVIARVLNRLDLVRQSGQAALWRVVRTLAVIASVLLVVYIIGTLELLREAIGRLDRVDPAQLATLTTLDISELVRLALVWPQVFTILLGASLIGLAAWLWNSAARRQTMPGMAGALGLALLLMIGGWLLIGQLPEAAAHADTAFFQSLLRTATYATMTVPVQLALGLLLAYLLFYEISRGKAFYRIVFFIPYVAPSVATAAVFAVIFSLDPQSPANQILGVFGIPAQQWLRDPRGIFEIVAQLIGGRQVHLPSFLVGPSLPLFSAVLYSLWVYSGYDAVIFLAGLGNVPHDLIEAAQVDGGGRWPIFRNIIFPLISPTTFFLSLLAIIGTFKAFDSIYVLRAENARGAMDTATVYIFELIRTGSKSWSYASSAAFVLFGIILVLTLIQNRVTQDQVFYG